MNPALANSAEVPSKHARRDGRRSCSGHSQRTVALGSRCSLDNSEPDRLSLVCFQHGVRGADLHFCVFFFFSSFHFPYIFFLLLGRVLL